ncbi:hypothetical protein Tco_1433793 [Tanacetum coccineum]
MSIPSLRQCVYDSAALLAKPKGAILELKRRHLKKTHNMLPYAVSSKRDTAYQRQLITRKRVRLIPNPAYHCSPIRRIQLVISQRSAVNVIDGN